MQSEIDQLSSQDDDDHANSLATDVDDEGQVVILEPIFISII